VEKYIRARQDTGDKIIRRMHIACCIPKATDPQSQYAIVTDSPLHQRLHKGVSILRYT